MGKKKVKIGSHLGLHFSIGNALALGKDFGYGKEKPMKIENVLTSIGELCEMVKMGA
ncbi:unnamed protein product, partial [Ilex paraguariensis]